MGQNLSAQPGGTMNLGSPLWSVPGLGGSASSTQSTGTGPQTNGFASINDVNALAPVNQGWVNGVPPGNSPIDAFMGNLFQNPGGEAPPRGGGTYATPAFGGDWISQMFSGMTGLNYPGPVPSALAPYGTQSSLFGNLVGLGNPMLLPMLLMMMNRPTTTVPFNPAVQPGSADANLGIYPYNGMNPYFPAPGSTLPGWVTPPFLPVPPVPGGASNLPGVLPPAGHGPFSPGQVGFGGEGGEGGGLNSGTSGYSVFGTYFGDPQTSISGVPIEQFGGASSYPGAHSAQVQRGATTSSATSEQEAKSQAQIIASVTGQPTYYNTPDNRTVWVSPGGGSEK